MKKYMILFMAEFCSMSSFAQAWAMDEAYDDAVESGATGFRGIFSLVVFFGIIYVLCKLFENKDGDKNTHSFSKNENTKIVTPSNSQQTRLKSGATPSKSTLESSQLNKTVVPKPIDKKPIETNEYILSYDSKILIKAKDVEILKIPQSVEIIKDRSFSDLRQIKEVLIPEGVQEIGDFAFFSSSVERIVIPSSVKKIGDNVFSLCGNLKEVIINEGVAYLGPSMFFNCENLEIIKLPSNLTAISKSCFERCTRLTNVFLPLNLEKICDSAFSNCESLQSIILPDSVQDIGFDAFSYCSELKTIIIPQNVVGISEYAFYKDYNLEYVELPPNLTCLMSGVFEDCCSIRLKIPLSLSHIESDSFRNCNDAIIEVPRGKKEWLSSILEDFSGIIQEYDYEIEYEQPIIISDRTKSFLDLHKLKEKIYSDERWESLGIKTNDDDFMLFDAAYDDREDVDFDL